MVRIAAIDVWLNSSWVTQKKPTVSRQIVHRADDRADRELPLEAEPEIGQDRDDGDDDAEGAALYEFGRDGRSDRIDAAELVVIREGLAQLGDRGLLARVAAGLHIEPQEHVGNGADLLHFDRAEAETLGLRPEIGDMRFAALGAQIDLGSAGEVDAEIHADEDEEQHRDDREGRRQRIAHAAEPHEAELGVLGREAKQFHAADSGLGASAFISAACSAAGGGTTARSSCGSWSRRL